MIFETVKIIIYITSFLKITIHFCLNKYLLEANEFNTIKESSSIVMISNVSCGFMSNSPLFLNGANVKSTTAQSAIT